MMVEKGKTNLRYILIIVILAAVVGGGSLWLSGREEAFSVELPSPEKIKKAGEIKKSEEPKQEKDIEIIDNLVIIRELDKEIILEKIEQGKEYLFRMIDPKEKGVHKYYYALSDSFEDRLHTIYTSSVIYTLLKIYNVSGKDELLLKQIMDSGEFVLSMQNKDKESKAYGAFCYSYYLEEKQKESKFVVGTTSKTIFTLLELYNLTGDQKYLEAAKLGADWLLTMQKEGGLVKPYLRYSDGKRFYGQKESLLYEGQVLSAFSRIYNLTGEQKYYDAAEKIAESFTQKVEKDGCYLGDDYRSQNPISSSWVILSLLDFYKASREEQYEDLVFRCSNELLERQITNTEDILSYGRWQNSPSTSGNGWINEVMVEIYNFCQEQNKDGCDKYKDAAIRVDRWIIQNTYSEENTSFLKNPERAIGGVFWNKEKRYVRTDSVCHALNGYLGIINDLGDGLLLSIPEKEYN